MGAQVAGSYQTASSALTSIAGLSWSSGTPFVKMTAAGTFGLDTSTYLTANQSITLGGILSGSGTTSITAAAASGYYMPSTTDQTNWGTAYTNRITSLTTTNSSGAATLSSNTLNIPNYTLAGLGGQANLSLVAGTYADGKMCTYTASGTLLNCNTTIPTVGTWGALNYPAWSSGTPFVKMTAAGTFALDSTAYGTFTLPALTSGSVLFSNGSTISQDNANFFWDATNHRLGIGTASPSTALALGTANAVISAPTGLTFQENGDTYGSVALSIQNRNGVNGAMFQQLGSVDLVDFVFQGLSNQRNIRYENRAVGSYQLAEPEFEIGVAGDPTMDVADTGVAIRKGGLSINSSIVAPPSNGLYVGGNVGLGVASPTAYLNIKAGTTAANTEPIQLTAGVLNTTAVSGALETDASNNLYYTNGTPTRGQIPLATAANTLFFTTGGATNVTLPTSGTLATNSGSNWTFASQAIGDIPYANSTTSYTNLADVATGSVLVSGGVGTAPTWSSSPTFTGLTLSGITGSTQYLQVNSSGVVSGTSSPTFTAPILGTATATTINGLALSLGYGSLSDNIAIGNSALSSTSLTGNNNIAVGGQILVNDTSGQHNVASGYSALYNNTTGSNNVVSGDAALYFNNTGSNNIAIGDSAGASHLGVFNNDVFIGTDTGGQTGTTPISNTVNIGYKAGTNLAGNGGVMIGNMAGAYETAGNAFYVNNVDQTNIAGDKAYSLLYGNFSGTAGSLTGQQLTVNGALNVNGTLTLNATSIITDTTTGLKIGTATNQLLGFYNATPIVKPSGNVLTALSNLGLVSTPTLSNKNIKRVDSSQTAVTTIAINSDNNDEVWATDTGVAGTLTISADTGSAQTEGQALLIKIQTTNSQTFSWTSGAKGFYGGTVALSTTTTGGGKIDYYAFIWESSTSHWLLTGVSPGF